MRVASSEDRPRLLLSADALVRHRADVRLPAVFCRKRRAEVSRFDRLGRRCSAGPDCRRAGDTPTDREPTRPRRTGAARGRRRPFGGSRRFVARRVCGRALPSMEAWALETRLRRLAAPVRDRPSGKTRAQGGGRLRSGGHASGRQGRGADGRSRRSAPQKGRVRRGRRRARLGAGADGGASSGRRRVPAGPRAKCTGQKLARPRHRDSPGAPACCRDFCPVPRIRTGLRTQADSGKGSKRTGGGVGADVPAGIRRPGGGECALVDLGAVSHHRARRRRRRALPGAAGKPVPARRSLASPPDPLELAPGREELRLRLSDGVLLRARFGPARPTGRRRPPPKAGKEEAAASPAEGERIGSTDRLPIRRRTPRGRCRSRRAPGTTFAAVAPRSLRLPRHGR